LRFSLLRTYIILEHNMAFKKIILLFIFALLTNSCIVSELRVLSFYKEGFPVPFEESNTVLQLNDSTWIDVTEVSASEWLEFIYYEDASLYFSPEPVTLSSIQSFQVDPSILPDQELASEYTWLYTTPKRIYNRKVTFETKMPYLEETMGTTEGRNGKPELVSYFNHPIVGVTYEQAQRFCRWRTSRDKLVAIMNGWDSWFEYSLPTIEEFKSIDYEMDSVHQSGRKTFHGSNYNYKNAVHKSYPKKSGDRFAGLYYGIGKATMGMCYDFWRPEGKPCNIKGNVSEMTQTKGIAMGGNYQLYASEYKIGDEIMYDKPEKWLGFRCIAKRVSR
jgi:hypothetical protein